MNRSLLARLSGATLSLSTLGVVANALPASAAEDPIFVGGNFVDEGPFGPSPGDEMLEYVPGPLGQDQLRQWSRQNGVYTWTPSALDMQVDSWYSPMAGDFNGDGLDDIFWNAAGTTPDYLWTSTDGGDFASHPVQLDGLQYTVAGDFTNDGADDIFYHGPGAAADGIIDFAPSATSAELGTRVHTAKTISGSYLPAAGNFASSPGDEVFFYGPAHPETIWTFYGTTAHSSWDTTPITATNYKPLVLNTTDDAYDDILLYLPGTGADHLWDFRNGTVFADQAQLQPQLNSTYTNFTTGDFFADGHEDAFFIGATTTRILDWYPDADGVARAHNIETGVG
jgi:hypothetical protein